MPAGGARGLRRQRAHREGARRARRRVQGGVARPVADVCVLEGGQGDPLARFELTDADQLKDRHGFGAKMLEKVREMLKTGTSSASTLQASERVQVVRALCKAAGVGQKTAEEWYSLKDPLGRRRARGGRDDHSSRSAALARPRRAHPARRVEEIAPPSTRPSARCSSARACRPPRCTCAEATACGCTAAASRARATSTC